MSTDPFNPTSNYEVPKGDSKYLKLEKGSTKFLILDSAIIGYEYWNTQGKPVHVAEKPTSTPEDIRHDDDGKAEGIKHFWAFPVWDYATGSVKVLEVTQKSLMNAMRDYTTNADWGSPVMSYSFTVTRKGDGLSTEYTIMANPAGTISEEIKTKWEQVQADGFDISRLFSGGDPFTDTSRVD